MCVVCCVCVGVCVGVRVRVRVRVRACVCVKELHVVCESAVRDRVAHEKVACFVKNSCVCVTGLRVKDLRVTKLCVTKLCERLCACV